MAPESERQEFARRLQLIRRELDLVVERLRGEAREIDAGAEGAFESVTGEPPEVARLRDAGIGAYEKIVSGDAGPISDEELAGLEAIVREARPAIAIKNDDFQRPPPEWRNLLGPHRARICEVVQRVGRVEVTKQGQRTWFGTGFLVGHQTIMTNSHVVTKFANCGAEGKWAFNSQTGSSLDFAKEERPREPREFVVEDIIGVHPEHDLALLRIASTSTSRQSLPEPLSIAANRPASDSRNAYVVGHPARDAKRNPPEAMRRVFPAFDVKMLLPGKANYFPPDRLDHDCSTLGGNSGSPVVDLETHAVIGLHFGGSFQIMNYAVALWTLTDDPLLKRGGVNFV